MKPNDEGATIETPTYSSAYMDEIPVQSHRRHTLDKRCSLRYQSRRFKVDVVLRFVQQRPSVQRIRGFEF